MQIGSLVLSPDDGCIGVIIEIFYAIHGKRYKVKWADGLEKWHWQEAIEIIA
jgi:hypothetical protein